MNAHPAPERPSDRVPARSEPLRRPDGRLRWIARLDPREEAAFARAVARIAPALERGLGDEVLANRILGRGRHATVELEPWRRARRTWSAEVTRALAERGARYAVVTDVRDCYGSISPRTADRALGNLGACPDEVSPFLRRFRDDGIRGLPIGPAASAVIANAVLLPLDAALRDTGVHHLRWVDDVIAFVPDRRMATRVIDAAERSLAVSGLSLNPMKTASFEREEALVRIVGGQMSPAGRTPWDDSAR
jgi:hypothetical protein